jgi:hypothetical protein
MISVGKQHIQEQWIEVALYVEKKLKDRNEICSVLIRLLLVVCIIHDSGWWLCVIAL